MGIGQKLRSARESIGLTLTEAGDKTGIAVSSLSELENGKREPRISQLAGLARCYHRSLSFFLDEEETPVPQILWRHRPEGNTVLEQERRFLKMCEQYQHLEMWCGDFVDPSLPRIETRKKPLDISDAEDFAEKVRGLLNLGDRPAFTLLRLLESNGVKIFHDDFEPTGTAICVKSDSLGMAILLNRGNTPERRNFDLAHELFHLVAWDYYRSNEKGPFSDTEDLEETLAGYFASQLLLPTEALRRAVSHRLYKDRSLHVPELYEIAQEFGVSIEALIWGVHRVYTPGRDRQNETRHFISEVQKGEVYQRYRTAQTILPAKYPERYRALAIRALNRGEMSIGKFMEYMDVSRREATSYLQPEENAAIAIQTPIT